MASFKKVQEIEEIIDNEKFVLLYEAYRPSNLQTRYRLGRTNLGLAEKFQGSVNGIYAQLQRAVYGNSDFRLAEEYSHLHIPSEQWMGMACYEKSCFQAFV